uniref:Ribosomal protein S13 n=1 Tax=Gelidium galapagense TaxID=317100 RepID=A0A411FSX3_9FLOR|nr:ribosomal protein S13 [Gelidium galapagense]QBA96509.1 ribosomal protein S13 [Gelidium galapagense]
MARIAGVDLPKNKRIEIGLTYIYGIGISRSQKIIEKTQINPDTIIKDLNDQEIVSIRQVLTEQYQIEGDLKRLESINIKRLIDIGSYRGKRHRNSLPLRGQRTRTNARTKRNSKKRANRK